MQKKSKWNVDVIICLGDGTWRKEVIQVETFYRRLAFTLGEDRCIERNGFDRSEWVFAVDARRAK